MHWTSQTVCIAYRFAAFQKFTHFVTLSTFASNSCFDPTLGEYQVQGTNLDFGNWTVTRQINTPWQQADGPFPGPRTRTRGVS